jgi:hypothetical protein
MKCEDWKRSYTRMLFVTNSVQLVCELLLRKLWKGLEA